MNASTTTHDLTVIRSSQLHTIHSSSSRMESTQSPKRKIEAVDPSDSDDEYAHITPHSSTYLTPKDSKTGCSIKCKTSERPRRAGVNYEPKPQGRASTFPRAGKRRKNKPVLHEEGRTQAQPRQLPPNDPIRSTSLVLLPSETTRPRKTTSLPEVREVQELLTGETRSNDLVVNNPAQSNSSPTVSNITLGLSMSYFSNHFVVIQKKAGDLLTHWRRRADVEGQRSDSNHYDSNNAQVTETSTITPCTVTKMDQSATSTVSITSPPQNLAHVGSNSLPSDSPSADEEESRSSYVKCDMNEHSEVSFEDIDTSTVESSEEPWTQDEEGHSAPTPPPPPQHGYPGTRDAYRENVPVLNALRWDGTALVWDNHDQPHSSRVLFDPGSTPNFISWELAFRLGFQPLLLPETEWKLFSTLHGQQDLARYYIRLDIEMKWLNFPRKTQYLLVVETDEIEIILGELFMAQYRIAERLVANAQARTAGRSFAIITSKPTPEQIRSVLLEKERRRRLAERVDANIEENQRLKRGRDTPSRQGTSYSSTGSTAGSAGEGVYGPKIATALNNSFEPAMGRDQGNRMPSHRQASMTSSFSRSSADNSSIWDSFDSSPTDSTHPSPATTFSSTKSTGSASFSFDRMKQKVGNRFNSKGKEKGKG